MSPFISIVVPIYNVSFFLRRCIESILRQSYYDFELILVNDGSTDDSGLICDNYLRMDSRVKVIHQTNFGLIKARKVGLVNAIGAYITYVDGDDWVESDFLSDFVDVVNLYQPDIIISNHKENLVGREEILKNKISFGFYSKYDIETKVLPFMICNGKFSQFGIFSYLWGKFYKKDALFSFQMQVDENIFIGEDAACLYPAILNANSLYVLNVSNYNYRQRVGSMIKSPDPDEVNKVKILYLYLKTIFEKSIYNIILIKQLQFYVLSLLTVRAALNHNKDFVYPFKSIIPGSSLIIYGAGTFGQYLYRNLENSDKFKIIAWIDELSNYYNELGMAVDSISMLKTLSFDYILIAYVDEDIANFEFEKLKFIGISENKIVKLQNFNSDILDIYLKELGIDFAQ
jgi:glycosyltransferase involved in cell wall biosynthesis